MPRGQATVQLTWCGQRHTPSTSLRMSSRSAAPSSRLSKMNRWALIEDEPVGVDDRGRAEVAALRPVDRGARRAQDALGGVVVAGPVGLALNPFPRRRIAGGDQETA